MTGTSQAPPDTSPPAGLERVLRAGGIGDWVSVT
jgi:hypothetical protein